MLVDCEGMTLEKREVKETEEIAAAGGFRDEKSLNSNTGSLPSVVCADGNR